MPHDSLHAENENWAYASLADIVTPDAPIQYGILQPGPDTPDGIPYIRPTEIRGDTILIPSLLRTSREIAAGYHRSSLRAGDIILSIVGTIGKVAIVPPPLDGANITQSSARLRPNPQLISSKFLASFLRSPQAHAQYRTSTLGTGVPRLNIGDIRQFSIGVPSLAEQKRIVAKIEELTARSRRAKEALDAVPPLLDQLRQSILAAAFRGDLTADWRAKNPNVEPADQLLARIRTERRARSRMQEDLPSIPSTWAWSTVDELSQATRPVCYGVVQPGDEAEEGVPLIRVCDLTGDGHTIDTGGLRRISRKVDEEYARSRLEGGELLVSVVGTIGQTAVVPQGLSGSNVARAIARISFLQPWLADWSAFWFRSAFMQDILIREAREVARKTLNIAQLAVAPIPVPPEPEALRLLQLLISTRESLAAILERARESTARVEALDQSILAKAFRGELVPHDPNDEPASVLLDRIRAARAESSAAPRRRGRAGPSAASEEVEDEGRRSQAPAARPAETGAAVDAPRRRGRPPKAAPRAPEPEPESSPAPSRRPHARAPDSESPPAPARRPPPPTAEPAPAPDSPPARRPGSPAADLTALDPDALRDHVFAALWTHGPLDKDAAVRRLADHLRQAGLVDYQRLRADGPLYTALLATIESAAKAGTLDRPGRGLLRASKPDPTTYTIDDWRHALLATLPQTPTDREEAIRAAAEWSRHHLGLQFTRLRADGHIITGLRSALNSAIRRHEITRHGPTLISRSQNPTQLPLTLDPPTPRRP